MLKKKPSKIRKVKFDYMGEDVEFEYDIVKGSKALSRLMDRLQNPDIDIQKPAAIEFLVAAITKWDLDDEDDNRMPISKESFDLLLYGEVINLFVEAIRKDIRHYTEILEKRLKH